MITLSNLFFENALRNPDCPALSVDAQDCSYGELLGIVERVGSWLTERIAGPTPRVGILASRSWEAYAGVLATSWAGATYVPLHPDWPEERLLRILKLAALDALIVDANGLKTLSQNILPFCPKHILAPASDSSFSLNSAQHEVLISGKDSLPSSASE